MARYFIRTWTEEGTMVCEYGYRQWKEVINSFRNSGRQYKAWIERF